MATLQIRELPEPIYQELRRLAKNENRSLSQEAIMVLARGLGLCGSPRERRHQLLQETVDSELFREGAKLTDPVAYIREDRER